MSEDTTMVIVDWQPAAGWLTDEAEIDGRACTRRSCDAPAAAFFYRTVRRKSGQFRRRWFCCPVHMYSRRVNNGIVEMPVRRYQMAPNTGATA